MNSALKWHQVNCGIGPGWTHGIAGYAGGTTGCTGGAGSCTGGGGGITGGITGGWLRLLVLHQPYLFIVYHETRSKYYFIPNNSIVNSIWNITKSLEQSYSMSIPQTIMI